VVLLAVPFSVSAQSTKDYQRTEDEIAANKRRGKLLLHPELVTLRLVSSSREPSPTPPPYGVGDLLDFDLSMSQSSSDTLTVLNYRSPFYECSPELYRDGDKVPYSKAAQEKVDRTDKILLDGSFYPVSLIPNREYRWIRVRLNDWYGRLGIGHYQLTVRKRLAPKGDWVESNPVTFDVILKIQGQASR